MVFVHLADEEKLQVLFLAFSLFLLALVISICIASTFCPLNKWLLERHVKKRRQQQLAGIIQPPGYLFDNGRLAGMAGQGKLAGCSAAYMGPPPAYEAALHATRLQLLTGSLSRKNSAISFTSKSPSSLNDWLQQQPPANIELDFGDYFHQPKEPLNNDLYPGSVHVNLPPGLGYDHQGEYAKNKLHQSPVMLRIWVRMMEPGELVARARGRSSSDSERPRSLSRQLSIPHLFGSLVHLAAGRRQQSQGDESNWPAAGLDQQRTGSDGHCIEHEMQSSESAQANCAADSRNLNSIVSTSGSSTTDSGSIIGQLDEQAANQQTAMANQTARGSCGSAGPADAEEASRQDSDQQPAPRPSKRKSARSPQMGRIGEQSCDRSAAITSRVLHMNVGSFSYVKDETLISTKKHNQMNYSHFHANNLKQASNYGQQARQAGNKSKFCQLVISVCDVENILNLSWLNERSCALLANNSAIYVQCDILAPKLKAGRLLSYPLRALQQSVGQATTNEKHTVNFEANIPATVIEPQRAPIGSQLVASSTSSSSNATNQRDFTPTSSSTTDESLAHSSLNQTLGQQQQVAAAGSANPTSTNWHHEPSADGTSIVSFNSVPKQIAHQQQLALSVYQQQQQQAHLEHQLNSLTQPAPDLIQFDSVFVSPILSKSTIEDGFVRFRIYSQCKYVNETCLAELKLPLKQLLHSETGDNLGDAAAMQYQFESFQPQQAEFILNNLLANLVTAATSSPLSTLIEQISFEEEETDEGKSAPRRGEAQTGERRAHSFRLPWLNCASPNERPANNKLRATNSFNESLFRLTSRQSEEQNDQGKHHQVLKMGGSGSRFDDHEGPDDDDNDDQLECDRERERQSCLEQNYCRSLMVSHWLNYLVAPSYECQLVEESRGKIILGLSYLPTSNRVIFNAHRASIDSDSCASGKQMMKKLRLQSSTCYLLRFLMVVNGRVVKRKQTPVARKAEWDSQEPITFDLVSISVEQPSFVVALVMRNANGLGRSNQTAINNTGSLQNLQQVQCCCQLGSASGCGFNQPAEAAKPGGDRASAANMIGGAQSEPESLQHLPSNNNDCHNTRSISHHQSVHGTDGGLYRSERAHCCSGASTRATASGCPNQQRQQQQQQQHQQRSHNERDLVIGHLVLGDEMWREMRSKPRKQIVRQFKMY